MDKTALFNLSYGVYVVSSADENNNVGCIVNSIFQVSSTPATIAISINKANYTNPCILNSSKFAVSVLTESVNSNVISTFGFKSSKDVNKFENFDFITTKNGLAILKTGVCSYLECKVINSVDCFTHTVILAEIINAENLSQETPMTYAYYHKVMKGKSPKNAPTYIAEKNTGKYICDICGYEYTGSHEEFHSLSDSYTCPICGALKALFDLK